MAREAAYYEVGARFEIDFERLGASVAAEGWRRGDLVGAVGDGEVVAEAARIGDGEVDLARRHLALAQVYSPLSERGLDLGDRGGALRRARRGGGLGGRGGAARSGG